MIATRESKGHGLNHLESNNFQISFFFKCIQMVVRSRFGCLVKHEQYLYEFLDSGPAW